MDTVVHQVTQKSCASLSALDEPLAWLPQKLDRKWYLAGIASILDLFQAR